MADELIRVEKRMGELGSTGLRKSGGIVHEEFLNKLSGNRGVRIFTEMRENDPIVAGMLFAIEMLFRRLHRDLTPGDDDSQEALDVRDFIEECLNDLEEQTIEEVISEVTSMFQYGWQVSEIVYKKRDDGRIGWKQFAPRAQETLWEWQFDPVGNITGFSQLNPYDGDHKHTPVTIPWEKMLLFRTTSYKNNPEGRSVLRPAYRPWYFKKRIEEIEAIGIERDMAGMPVIYAPEEYFDPDAPDNVKSLFEELKSSVRDIRRDATDGMVFPLAYDMEGNERFRFELASTGGRRQIDTSEVIERYSRHMAMTTLADFILLGHEQVGSFALSSSKVDLFATAIDAWSSTIADVFNKYAIPRLMKLNGIEPTPELKPKLSFEPVRTPSLSEVGEYVKNLTSSGAALFPDEKTLNHLLQRAGIPAQDPDSDAVEVAGPKAAAASAEAMKEAGVDQPGTVSQESEDEDEDE